MHSWHFCWLPSLPVFKRQLSGLMSVSSKASPFIVSLKSPCHVLPEAQQTKQATRGCCGAVICQVYDSNDFLRQGTSQNRKLSVPGERKGRGEKKIPSPGDRLESEQKRNFANGSIKSSGL